MLPLQEAIRVSIQELNVITSFAVAPMDFRQRSQHEQQACVLSYSISKERMIPRRDVSVRLEGAFRWLHRTHNAMKKAGFTGI